MPNIATLFTTPPFRRIRILYATIALFLLPLFFMGGPDWTSGPLFKAAWNLGHILFFALFTLALQPQDRLSGVRLWLGMTLAVIVAGIVIEWLQGNLGRQSDWHDILRNLVGTWLVLAWVKQPAGQTYGARQSRARAIRWLLRGIALALLAVELTAVAAVALRQYHISQQLPTLYDFSQSNPLHFWRGNVYRSTEHTFENDFSLRIELGTNFYTGAALDNLPDDWRNYEALVVTIFNPERTPVDMTLRVNDVVHDRGRNAYNDRYNRRLPLQSGMNRVRIPLSEIRDAPASRTMDMDEIRRLVIFTTQLEQRRELYLQELSLD
ncbi:VanZ family protein [Marinobacter fonticola]|uniref:succinyl-CoA synthetase subunit beta n=1 Tax=Marinobacter fonticola TaxID=2603215 RepID=UPI0011E63720|nr:succinyl-CoA synthetase subunit beta [Marinobacter fonticola]